MHRRRLPAPGSRAPEFRLARLGGGEVTLADLTASGPAVLAFFKVSCPVCQFTFPFLERIHAGGTLPVYGVSQNGAGQTREFSREFGLSFPMLLDAEEKGFEASNAFGISSVPTLVLVEQDGTVAWTAEGFGKRDLEFLGGRSGVSVFRPGERIPDSKAG